MPRRPVTDDGARIILTLLKEVYCMNFDTYVLLLCLTVLVFLLVFFSVLISTMMKMNIKLIEGGLLDAEIQAEYDRRTRRKNNVFQSVLGKIVPSIVCFLLLSVFIFSLLMMIGDKGAVLPKVVNSNSMSYKSEKNTYLYEYELDDQIKRYDIIFLSTLPKERDIKLYDVVAYETVDGFLCIHRIIGIVEEPCMKTYILRGDANSYSDPMEVTYSQMKGIYNGKRIPHIGSFIIFLQTPIGWLCIIIIVFCLAILPFIRRKIQNAIDKRLSVIRPENQPHDNNKTE